MCQLPLRLLLQSSMPKGSVVSGRRKSQNRMRRPALDHPTNTARCGPHHIANHLEIKSWRRHRKRLLHRHQIPSLSRSNDPYVCTSIFIKIYFFNFSKQNYADYDHLKTDAKRLEHFEALMVVLRQLFGGAKADTQMPSAVEVLKIYGRVSRGR